MSVATATGVRLAGGTDLVVRPLRPSDWCAIHELLDVLSHDARYHGNMSCAGMASGEMAITRSAGAPSATREVAST